MINGFLNILKPPGMTSSDVVGAVRRMLPKGARVGHAGTLDPEAAGVLPIMVGKAARLFDYLVDKEKAYAATLVLGAETDTQDAQGTVVSRSDTVPNRADIEAVLPRLTGRILQQPPMFSALKQGGVRLYELARAGKTVDIPARETDVFSLELGEQLSAREYQLFIRCGKGTYVRTICHDIGRMLGCGAHMGFLLRTQSGVFTLEDAVTLAQAAEGLDALRIAMDAPLAHLPRADAGDAARAAAINGNPLPRAMLAGEPPADVPLRVYVAGEFAGIGRYKDGAVRFDAMLLEREQGEHA